VSGCLPDPFDSRDLRYGQVFGGPEPDVRSDLWRPEWDPRNQRRTNRCVGFTLARTLQVGYFRIGKEVGEFSANDAYFKSRLEHDAEDVDNGTYLRTCFKGVQKYGCAPEEVRKSSLEDINTPTTWREQKAAHKFRGLRSYYRIASHGDELLREVRLALSQGFAVAGGFPMPPSFSRYTGGVYDPSDDFEGGLGHAMAVLGHERDGTFKLESNYGSSFGEGGFVRVSEEFLTTAWSLWVGDVR